MRKIPSFIVTLGGMLIFRGLTGNLLLGQFVGPFPRGFQDISVRLHSRFHATSALRTRCSADRSSDWGSMLIGVIGVAILIFMLALRRWQRARAEAMEAEPLRAVRRQEPRSSRR